MLLLLNVVLGNASLNCKLVADVSDHCWMKLLLLSQVQTIGQSRPESTWEAGGNFEHVTWVCLSGVLLFAMTGRPAANVEGGALARRTPG